MQAPEGGIGVVEKVNVETPNLATFRHLAAKFQQANSFNHDVSLEEFEDACNFLGGSYKKILQADGTVNFNELLNFGQELVGAKLDKTSEYAIRMGAQQPMVRDPDVELLDLGAFLKVKKFVLHTSEMTDADWRDYAADTRDISWNYYPLRKIEDDMRGYTKDSVIKEGLRLYEEDALRETSLQLGDRLLSKNDWKDEGSKRTFDRLRDLSICFSPEQLQNQYRQLLADVNGSSYFSSAGMQFKDHDLRKAKIYDLMKSGSGKFFDEADVPAELRKEMYTEVSNDFFRTLFDGGYESGDGTAAASWFYSFKDPRALSSLINHNRTFGTGHTSVVVSSAIQEIAKNPTSKEDLEKALVEMKPLDRQITNQWLLDSDSFFYEAGIYSKPTLIQEAEKYLVFDQLARLANSIAARQGITIPRDTLASYFQNAGNEEGFYDFKEVNNALILALDQTARLIARAKVKNLKSHSPELFNALVNPKDGNYLFFPKIIAKDVMGISDDALEKLAVLYQSRDLRTGAFARESFVEGLIFFANRENGREELEYLLEAAKGSSRDSERLRRVFRQAQTLNALGGFEKFEDGELTVISDRLLGKIVEIYRDKLGLDDSEAQSLKVNLDRLVENGFLEIVTTLLGQYENSPQRVSLMKDISRHVISGDFKQWREGLEASLEQLAVLPEDRRRAWTEVAEPIELSITFSDEAEKRTAAVDGIRRIAQEAKAHVLDVFKMDFSDSRIAELKNIRAELVQSLRGVTIEDEKRELGIRKARIDGELELVEGLRYLESLSADELGKRTFIDRINKTIRAMRELEGLEQPINDLEQINEVLTTEKSLGEVQRLTILDTDDPIDLLKVGVEPRETCQSWRKGSFNQCLPSNLSDANKRLLNVVNDKKEVMARSIIKLSTIRLEDGTEVPSILMEPTYTSVELPELYRGIVRMAMKKAKETGAVLVVGRDQTVMTGADQKLAVSVLEKEAPKSGFGVERKYVEITLPRSNNYEEYSDTLGGLLHGGVQYWNTMALVATMQ